MVRYPGFSANLAMLFQDEECAVSGVFWGCFPVDVRFQAKFLDTFKSILQLLSVREYLTGALGLWSFPTILAFGSGL